MFLSWIFSLAGGIVPWIAMFGEGEDALKPAASQASGSWEHVPDNLSSLIVDLEDQGQEPDGHSPKPSSVADDTPIDADDEFDGDADLRGFRLKWSKKRRTAQEPVDKDSFGNDGCLSSSPSSTLPAVSSNVDDALSLASAMADRIVASSIVLPWESELMSPIFGSVVGQLGDACKLECFLRQPFATPHP